MQSEREQSWRIRVTAKANNFNFRLRFAASTYKPNWTLSFCRFSILLKLPKFALRINSHPTQPTHGRGFFTTKFMKIVHKIRAPLLKKKESNYPHLKEAIRIGFWVMGFLACVAQSINKKDLKGIVMLASVGPLLLLFRKLKTVKFMNLAAFCLVVVAATISCYQLFNFDYDYWYHIVRFAWNQMVNH